MKILHHYIIRSLKFLIIIFFLVSCATTAKYEKLLNTWREGGNVNDLISNWRAPTSTFKMSNGNMILTYMRSSLGIS